MAHRPLGTFALRLSDAEEIAAVTADDDILSFLDVPTDEVPATRPACRTECVNAVRPCPWVSCRYNLFLDVRADGVIKLNFPGREPDEMTTSCALDLADDGPRTLDAVAVLMGMSRERARQIEDRAMSQIRRDFYPQDLLGDETDSDLDL
jgi:hypothetical protein